MTTDPGFSSQAKLIKKILEKNKKTSKIYSAQSERRENVLISILKTFKSHLWTYRLSTGLWMRKASETFNVSGNRKIIFAHWRDMKAAG